MTVRKIATSPLGPNRNLGRFTIKATLTSEEDVRVEVMSMHGSVVFSGGSLAASKYHELTFNLTTLRCGYYFVKVTSGTESKILEC